MATLAIVGVYYQNAKDTVPAYDVVIYSDKCIANRMLFESKPSSMYYYIRVYYV
jgi:hypothetical protein